MPSTYSGVPASGAVAPAVSITEPADGDAMSAASVNTALEKLSDHVAFLQMSDGTTTYVAGSGAGTSPTVTIVGNDRAGKITLLTGSTPGATSTVLTLTLGHGIGGSYCTAPVIQPVDGAAAAASAQVTADGVDGSTWEIVNRGTALTGATTYTWHYQVQTYHT